MESTQNKDTPIEEAELKIDSNQINVSDRKNKSFYVFLGKKILEKFDDVCLNALGNATTTAVLAAESLVRNGYADYVKIETKTIEVEQSRRRGDDKETEGEAEAAKVTVPKAKLVLTLKKSPHFDANMKKFAEIREENDKLMEAEKAARALATDAKDAKK